MDINTDKGMVSVNLKLSETVTAVANNPPTYSFELNANDIDVPVESFYNVAQAREHLPDRAARRARLRQGARLRALQGH